MIQSFKQNREPSLEKSNKNWSEINRPKEIRNTGPESVCTDASVWRSSWGPQRKDHKGNSPQKYAWKNHLVLVRERQSHWKQPWCLSFLELMESLGLKTLTKHTNSHKLKHTQTHTSCTYVRSKLHSLINKVVPSVWNEIRSSFSHPKTCIKRVFLF